MYVRGRVPAVPSLPWRVFCVVDNYLRFSPFPSQWSEWFVAVLSIIYPYSRDRRWCLREASDVLHGRPTADQAATTSGTNVVFFVFFLLFFLVFFLVFSYLFVSFSSSFCRLPAKTGVQLRRAGDVSFTFPASTSLLSMWWHLPSIIESCRDSIGVGHGSRTRMKEKEAGKQRRVYK